MNIYVGNLAYKVTEEDLRQAFEAFGEVTSAMIVKDRYSGESRGFGFVEMPDRTEGESAITGLKDKDLKGRSLRVDEARPRSQGPRPQGRRSGRRRRGGVRVGGNRSGWRHS
ncbi:MAG: RNA-binding protein [Deltaproteobacteria bacterium]|nr:MAG: RNA-binding protein [Deltaproteobacteria bacterium]